MDNVIQGVAEKGFCIGCGTCAGVCPKKNIEIRFDEFGEFKPFFSGSCADNCTLCLDICPRSVTSRPIDELSMELFADTPSISYSTAAGYYLSCYEGFSMVGDHRKNGASGGLATWFLEQLLRKKKIDGVACVRSTVNSDKLFEFFITNSISELREASSSAYYPVEMSHVLQSIRNKEGRYAVVGVPCFLNALSLAQKVSPKLNKRILYKVGLVCGRLPNKRYIKYFEKTLDLSHDKIVEIRFRDKTKFPSNAKGIKFQTNNGRTYYTNNRIDFAWGTGAVCPTACMFCDDVFAETADVSFMDSWTPKYKKEHYGVSLVLIRKQKINNLFNEEGIEGGLNIKPVEIEKLIAAQELRLKNKRQLCQYRHFLAKRWQIPCPPKKRSHSKVSLSMKEKLFAMAIFYQQQTTHGNKVPLKNRLKPTCALLLFDLITLVRKAKRILQYGKLGGAIVEFRK